MPREKGEQPPLEAERDARRRGWNSGSEAEVERLAKEDAMQIEGGRGDALIGADREHHLVLQFLELL